jgi:chaperonin GroES
MPKKCPITPLGDKVVVRPLTEDEKATKSASGIILPASVGEKDKNEQGVVVAVGEGAWNEDGDARIPLSVSVGDKVLFATWKEAITFEKETFFVIPESDIHGVIS